MRNVEARIRRLEQLHGNQQRPLVAVEDEAAAEQYQGDDVVVVITGVPERSEMAEIAL